MIGNTLQHDSGWIAIKPRVGFLGVGWIGRHRMTSLVKSGFIRAAAIAEPSKETAEAALSVAPEAVLVESLDALLEQDLEGIVIATPSALHAGQTISALENGHAVFCQKPLGRDLEETAEVVQTAKRLDLLLAVDYPYRYLRGMRMIRDCIREGLLGEVFAVDLVFHNAYGPDKSWFYDPRQSGGGCMLDLGTHLIDLALWTLGYAEPRAVTSRLFCRGRPLSDASVEVEDFASARIDLACGALVSITTSWKLSTGQDAVIEASFHGTKGGAKLRNVNGSFYDFIAEMYHGTSREVLAEPPDDWEGGAIIDWARRLSVSGRFDPEALHLLEPARIIDRIYGR